MFQIETIRRLPPSLGSTSAGSTSTGTQSSPGSTTSQQTTSPTSTGTGKATTVTVGPTSPGTERESDWVGTDTYYADTNDDGSGAERDSDTVGPDAYYADTNDGSGAERDSDTILDTYSQDKDPIPAPRTTDTPFWKKWWFWALVAGGTVVVGTGMYYALREKK